MYRYHGRAEVDPSNPRAFGVCDRCGFLYNLVNLMFQYRFAGTATVNTNFRVCSRCLDPLNPQSMTRLLPPDPMPVLNARVEPYMLDEVDFLSTQDEVPIETQDDEIIVTNQASQNYSEPNP
jgi:hypothetical protein